MLSKVLKYPGKEIGIFFLSHLSGWGLYMPFFLVLLFILPKGSLESNVELTIFPVFLFSTYPYFYWQYRYSNAWNLKKRKFFSLKTFKILFYESIFQDRGLIGKILFIFVAISCFMISFRLVPPLSDFISKTLISYMNAEGQEYIKPGQMPFNLNPLDLFLLYLKAIGIVFLIILFLLLLKKIQWIKNIVLPFTLYVFLHLTVSIIRIFSIFFFFAAPIFIIFKDVMNLLFNTGLPEEGLYFAIYISFFFIPFLFIIPSKIKGLAGEDFSIWNYKKFLNWIKESENKN